MTPLDWLLIVFCLAATSLHVASTALAMQRCRKREALLPPPEGAPAVSILRPLRGVDSTDELTLRSGFALDYPNFELIFCCADTDDPAVALVNRLQAQHPTVKARLLIGNHVISANPKLNNLVKGWVAAGSDWIVFADSNVLMPRDYVQRLLAGWRHDTGILCSPPIACNPRGFWAELECAFLNTYQARWQYAADSLGHGFAQGKTMLVRRRDLAQAGGIQALAEEIAEDAAATKLVRRQGLSAHLVDAPFGQPLGERTARQVWDRQTRWARLRRMSFPGCFAAEILTGCLLPLSRRRLCCRYAGRAGRGAGGELGRDLVRQRSGPGTRSRLEPQSVVSPRLGPARRAAAAGMGARLAERRLRLARQRHQHRRKQRPRALGISLSP